MPNIVDRQIIEEGPRNAVVKLTGDLDTSDTIEAPAISLTDFSNNDPMATLVGFRVDEIQFSISEGLQVILSWNGLNPQQIAILAKSSDIEPYKVAGFLPDQWREGYDGSINLVTNGFDPARQNGFTLSLKLVKLYKV